MMESKAGSSKVVTLRLPHEEAERAEFVARVEEISVNDLFRRALDNYVSTLRADKEFVARAKALVARQNAIASQMV